MRKNFRVSVGERCYVRIGKRTYYAEWDGTKWNKLPWPTRR